MKTNPTWDRVEAIKKALGLKKDTEFYRLAGAKKELGAQWKSGQVKMIGAEYAFALEDKTGFQARWIMLGQGRESKNIDSDEQLILDALPHLSADLRESWIDTARKVMEKAKAATTTRLLEIPPAGETTDLIKPKQPA